MVGWGGVAAFEFLFLFLLLLSLLFMITITMGGKHISEHWKFTKEMLAPRKGLTVWLTNQATWVSSQIKVQFKLKSRTNW